MKIKNTYILLLILFLWSTMSMNGQVTIGTSADPHKGAVLDLQSNDQNGGLLLPRVTLTDAGLWAPLGDVESDAKNGMVVYNISPSKDNGLKGKGMYVWSEHKWRLLLKGVLSKGINIVSDNDNNRLEIGKSLLLTATVSPDNASNKNVKWYVSSPGFVTLSDTTSTQVTVTGTAVGVVSVVAISEDESHVASLFTLTVFASYNCSNDANHPSFVTGASGYEYKTLSYPTGASGASECWMIENSHEGVYAARYYSNDPSKDHGSYYSWYQAVAIKDNNPCPTGWKIPANEQWSNLRTAVLAHNNPQFWTNPTSAGIAGMYQNEIGFSSWEQAGAFWTVSESTYVFIGNNTMYEPDFNAVSFSHYYSVRCVKQ